ncbi:transposase family protein [Streptomyces sp. NBC_00439]|uniref:helix-turn-helix domain-containing protein n=1 Tax=Streptomyces sp. NBC_00439 TaxID=2903650 RepID=UPI0022555BD5|nr:transposase family protein [Streptomyces sp. NBC_00439]MCX5103694.1 transposase family protein [Streptomyces sp. NBC_00439]
MKLAFTDRLLVTLICLRHQLPHAALAELYQVDRSTVSRRCGRYGPCSRPAASPSPTGPASGSAPWRTRSPTRRPRTSSCALTAPKPRCAGPRLTDRAGRKAFVSDKKKQNTIKTTSFSDGQGRVLFPGGSADG